MYCRKGEDGELTITLSQAMAPEIYIYGLLDVVNAAALHIAQDCDLADKRTGDVAMGISGCCDMMHALLNEVKAEG